MLNDAGDEEKIKFLQEAVIMGQFRSPYIVRLFGVITSTFPVSEKLVLYILIAAMLLTKSFLNL